MLVNPDAYESSSGGASLKGQLLEMPNVAKDEDFERQPDS